MLEESAAWSAGTEPNALLDRLWAGFYKACGIGDAPAAQPHVEARSERYLRRSGERIVLDALHAGLSPEETAERIYNDIWREDILFGGVECGEPSEELRTEAEAREDYPDIVRALLRMSGRPGPTPYVVQAAGRAVNAPYVELTDWQRSLNGLYQGVQ